MTWSRVFISSRKPDTTANTNPLLVKNIMNWLAERGISQTVFAKLYMERSQGTVSMYLNNPPKEVPPGLGKTPLVMME